MNLESVDVNVLSTVIGVTPRQVQRLVKGGIIQRAGRGRYNLPKCVQAWGAHLVAGKAPEGLATERRRLVAAQARRAEMENKQMAEELLPFDHVQYAVKEAMIIVTTQMMALPGRMAAVLAGESNPANISKQLKSEVHRIRTAAADRLAVLAANGGKR